MFSIKEVKEKKLKRQKNEKKKFSLTINHYMTINHCIALAIIFSVNSDY